MPKIPQLQKIREEIINLESAIRKQSTTEGQRTDYTVLQTQSELVQLIQNYEDGLKRQKRNDNLKMAAVTGAGIAIILGVIGASGGFAAIPAVAAGTASAGVIAGSTFAAAGASVFAAFGINRLRQNLKNEYADTFETTEDHYKKAAAVLVVNKLKEDFFAKNPSKTDAKLGPRDEITLAGYVADILKDKVVNADNIINISNAVAQGFAGDRSTKPVIITKEAADKEKDNQLKKKGFLGKLAHYTSAPFRWVKDKVIGTEMNINRETLSNEEDAPRRARIEQAIELSARDAGRGNLIDLGGGTGFSARTTIVPSSSLFTSPHESEIEVLRREYAERQSRPGTTLFSAADNMTQPPTGRLRPTGVGTLGQGTQVITRTEGSFASASAAHTNRSRNGNDSENGR